VFPCIELLKWLIDHTDAQKCLINDDNDECVGVFLPSEVQSYYKLREPEENMSTDFVVSFYAAHDTSKIMASWWREDKKFMNRTTGWYPTANLREPYIYLMALLCRLHGEKDCSLVFRGLDASSLYGGHFRHKLQLGCHHLQTAEYLYMTSPDTERGRNPLLLHGLVSVGHHLCQECFFWNELKLTLLRTPSPCILQHLMGKQVQKILFSYL
jgi:hypothetical protein